MKIKAISAILLSLTLMATLISCGTTPKIDSDTPPSGTPSGSQIKVDYEADGEQMMSDKRVAKSVLAEAYHNWYTPMSAADRAKLTYEDVVKQVGMEATTFQRSGNYRTFIWLADGDDSAKLHITLQERDGKWTHLSLNANNLGAT